MSREYAISRVEDALEQSGGNHLKAQRLLLQWLEKDTSLFIGLATPHIQSIVSHAISHVDELEHKKALAKEEATKEPQEINLENQKTGELGDALLSNLGLGQETGSFGESNPTGDPKPTKASQAHIDALKTIAQATRDKK